MAGQHNAHNEPEQLARKFFVLTGLGVVAFVTVVMLVNRYMPSNGGADPTAPAPTLEHLAHAH